MTAVKINSGLLSIDEASIIVLQEDVLGRKKGTMNNVLGRKKGTMNKKKWKLKEVWEDTYFVHDEVTGWKKGRNLKWKKIPDETVRKKLQEYRMILI